MEERAVKGGNVANTLECLHKWLSADEYNAFLARLPPETLELTKRRVFAVEWVPYSIWHHVTLAIYEQVCGRDEAKYIQMNERFAEAALNGTYKFIMKLMRTSDLLQRLTKQFSAINNRGRIEIKNLREAGGLTTLQIEVIDHAPWEAYSMALHGILGYALRASGAKDLEITRSPSVIRDGGLYFTFDVQYR